MAKKINLKETLELILGENYSKEYVKEFRKEYGGAENALEAFRNKVLALQVEATSPTSPEYIQAVTEAFTETFPE